MFIMGGTPVLGAFQGTSSTVFFRTSTTGLVKEEALSWRLTPITSTAPAAYRNVNSGSGASLVRRRSESNEIENRRDEIDDTNQQIGWREGERTA